MLISSSRSDLLLGMFVSEISCCRRLRKALPLLRRIEARSACKIRPLGYLVTMRRTGWLPTALRNVATPERCVILLLCVVLFCHVSHVLKPMREKCRAGGETPCKWQLFVLPSLPVCVRVYGRACRCAAGIHRNPLTTAWKPARDGLEGMQGHMDHCRRGDGRWSSHGVLSCAEMTQFYPLLAETEFWRCPHWELP